MTKHLTYYFCFILLFGMNLHGQNVTDRLNSLPPTEIERAPVFDIEKKYNFIFDSINNQLIIHEIHRKPETLENNPYQIIFEIPFSDLSIGSFRPVKSEYNSSLLKLKIGTIKEKASINYYTITNDEVVLIEAQGIIYIGGWAYSEELEYELKEIIHQLTQILPNKSYETNIFVKPGAKGSTKFISDRVTFPAGNVTDKELDGGYYYSFSLLNPSYYSHTNNRSTSNQKLHKDIKSQLRKNKISTGRTPVLIHISETGKIESIFVYSLSNEENRALELRNFSDFSPGNDGSENLKTKYIYIYQ